MKILQSIKDFFEAIYNGIKSIIGAIIVVFIIILAYKKFDLEPLPESPEDKDKDLSNKQTEISNKIKELEEKEKKIKEDKEVLDIDENWHRRF
jgi:hypothetical protein